MPLLYFYIILKLFNLHRSLNEQTTLIQLFNPTRKIAREIIDQDRDTTIKLFIHTLLKNNNDQLKD